MGDSIAPIGPGQVDEPDQGKPIVISGMRTRRSAAGATSSVG